MSEESTQSTASTGSESAASTSASVDTSSTTSSAASTTTAPAKADAAIAAQAKVEGVQSAVTPPVVPATNAYTPNFKYKAVGIEKEIDPFFHALIKDADSEKKIKDVFSKVDAFDFVKGKLDTKEKDFLSLQNDFNTQAKMVENVRQAYRNKDFDSIFRTVGLSDHEIIQWAAKKVDYLQMLNQLPPEQQQAIKAQEQAAIQNQTYQDQLATMQRELQEQKVQARTFQLEQSLSRKDVASAVSFWDTQMGKEGAFKDMVIEEAQREWYLNQVDLTPEEAISRVMQKFGKFIGAQTQGPQGEGVVPPAPNQTVPQMPSQKPVIPVVPGSSKTPIKKQYKSIADLKARAKELEA